MFRIIQLPNYSPDDVGDVSSPGDKGFGVEEDLAILKEGTEEVEDDKSDEDEETDDESESTDKEDAEGDDSEEESDEEDKEDDTEEDEEPEEPEEEDEIKVTVKGIKKDFPDFFKKHPEMKGVIFREKQYSEIYNNPQEAQDAAKLANQFNAMEADLLSGDTEPLFKALKKANDGKNFESFIGNLLPNLKKVDSDAYYKVAAIPIKQALRTAFKNATKSNDKNLANSAQWVHNFLFGNTNVDEKADLEDLAKPAEKSDAEKAYEKKLQDINARDHHNYKVSIDEQFGRGVEKAFLDGLDPDNILSEKTKTWMLRDLFDELNEQMVKDTRYMRNINGIWNQARNSGYNASFKTRIVSTSLARAKQLIPAIRQKLRSEALGERRRLSKSKEHKESTKRITTGSDNTRKQKLNKSDTRGMTDLEIIRMGN